MKFDVQLSKNVFSHIPAMENLFEVDLFGDSYIFISYLLVFWVFVRFYVGFLSFLLVYFAGLCVFLFTFYGGFCIYCFIFIVFCSLLFFLFLLVSFGNEIGSREINWISYDIFTIFVNFYLLFFRFSRSENKCGLYFFVTIEFLRT